MPRRIYTYGTELGVGWLNAMSTLGALVQGIAILFFLWNMWYSRRNAKPAGKNPWKAATLEWAMSSPPPVYNFSVLPEVTNRLPLWTTGGVNDIPDVPPGPIHVPGGSIWPLLTAVGIVTLGIGGLLHSIPLAIIGALATGVFIYAWAFEPFEV